MGGFQSNPGPMPFEAASAIDPHTRVKMASNGQVAIAGASERGFGTTVNRALAAGDKISVKTFNDPGSHRCVASKAIATIGSTLYAAAGGKVTDTAGTVKIGVNKEAAGADGEKLEVIAVIPD